MKTLNFNQLQSLTGGICQIYPGESGDYHPGTDTSACFNVWLCLMTSQITGGGIGCLIE